MECTWKDCRNKAAYPQLDKHGSTWANLCSEHHEELEKVFGLIVNNPVRDNIKRMLAAWVKASGGAKVMAGNSTIPKKATILFGELLKLKKGE